MFMNTKSFLKLSSPYRRIANLRVQLVKDGPIVTLERFASPTADKQDAFAIRLGKRIKKISKNHYMKIIKSTLK